MQNALEAAKKQEKVEGGHDDYAATRGVDWVVKLRSVSIYFTLSRAINAVVNYYRFILTMFFLFGDYSVKLQYNYR